MLGHTLTEVRVSKTLYTCYALMVRTEFSQHTQLCKSMLDFVSTDCAKDWYTQEVISRETWRTAKKRDGGAIEKRQTFKKREQRHI